TIKSGTNELHGNVFEYWRDSSLAANSFFNNKAGAKKAELSQHIFGGTLGGPIVKNKIFFFGDYQGFVRNVPSELVRSVAPENWRRGALSDAGVTIIDPQTGQPFPGHQTPPTRISPIATAIPATLSEHAINELLLGFTKVKFQTLSTDWAGIGDANASVGIPGGQAIPGLSSFVIGNFGFGSAANQEFNDIKSYQLTEKFSLFKGRHTWKFGGRWLYQRQGFSYSGNEGVLGHFDYTGARSEEHTSELQSRSDIVCR